MKTKTYAEFAEENEPLAAHVERLRRVIINATNSGAQTDSGLWVYSIDDSVLDETPTTSLAHLKAKWQADALEQLLYEGRNAREADTVRAFARNRVRAIRRHIKEPTK